MKKLYFTLLFFVTSLYCTAQVTNSAISLERNGRISLGTLQDDTALDGTTLQLWMNPQHWIPGANVVTWGNSLNIQLGNPGQLVIKSAEESITFTDSNLASGNWAHLTLLLDNGIRQLVNNANEQSSTLPRPFVIPADAPLLLGGGFLGRIDEVRVWDFILPAEYNRYWNNSIDSFNPQWQHLAAYRKFDQTRLATNAYDYTGKGHNGTFSASGAKRTAVTDNPGYTGSSRIYDGGFIALATGEEITASDIAASDGSEITVTIDKEGKGINITAGAVSGIEDAKEGTQQAVVYDLAGRRVQRITDRGIYIVGGKKQIKR